jgi:hypothetical protein
VSESTTHNAWGRVAPDGTVFVRTSTGEREVGQWQAGSADEALAFYARRYDTLAAEVDLLERRLETTDVSAADVSRSIERLRPSITEAAAVGDLEGLIARLDRLGPLVETRKQENAERRAAAKQAAINERERIVAEAESLVEATNWKATGERFKTLLDEWKAAPRIDRPTEQVLWKRFSTARTQFDRRRRAYFASLGAQREEAKTRKTEIVTEAETLATSTEWAPTAARMRALMEDWKAAPRGSRDDEAKLWARMRAAQQTFFEARSAAFDERDKALTVNVERKEAVLVDAEAILPITDLKSARASLRTIHDRWAAAGQVPRADRDRLEARLRVVDEAVREAEQAEWHRTNPEARARAEGAVSQLEAAIAKLESQLEAAQASGDDAKVQDIEAALEARRSWLAEAARTLEEFSR